MLSGSASRGARPERACEALAFALRQRLLDPPRGRLAEACSVDLADDATQRALGLHNALPHGLGAWQEPRRRERRGVCLAPQLAERNTNDVGHPSPSLAEKLLVLHRLPSRRKGVLRAQTAPPIVVNSQLLTQARNVLGRTPTANHAVLVPADVRQVGDLVDAATLPDPACMEPCFRKEMVGFASRARALRGRVEQVLKKLIGEKRPRSENDLGRSECKCSGSPCLLRLQRRDERVRPVVARDGLAHRVVERAHEAVGVVRFAAWQPAPGPAQRWSPTSPSSVP